MIEKNLSMQDFTNYFEYNRLGKLYFPNGYCFDPLRIPFSINLRDLYKLVTGWTIDKTSIPLDNIVGIIAFGSAVRFPGYEDVSTTRKKYLLFGPEVTKTKQIPIQPNDADFLVITGENIVKEEVIEPVSTYVYGEGVCIKEGGIHLVNRGIEQVVNGVLVKDTVSVSAMREGVPVFYNGRLSDVQSRTGITRETPRIISWDKNKYGDLIGIIV